MAEQAREAASSPLLAHSLDAVFHRNSLRNHSRPVLASSVVAVALLISIVTFLEWFHLYDVGVSRWITKHVPLVHQGPVASENISTCGPIPYAIRQDLQSASSKEVVVFSEDTQTLVSGPLSTPARICILVTIPQKPLPEEEHNLPYTDKPVPGKGPDLIHLLANSTDVILTFPPMLPLPGQRFETVPQKSIIYHASADILHSGTYNISATHEYSNWKWAQEWHVRYSQGSFSLDGDVAPDEVFEAHEFFPEPLPSTVITVSGLYETPQLPVCNHTVTAGQGRWYRQQSFPLLNTDTVDETGYAWQGDHCTLDYYSQMEVLDCLADKTIHVYGDSMVRRETKAIMNGGKWCLNVDDKCQDQDDRPEVPLTKLDVDSKGEIVESDMPGLNDDYFGHDQINNMTFGKNTTLYFTFVTTLTNATSLWMKAFYEDKDLMKPPVDPNSQVSPDYEIRPAARSRASPEMNSADVVYVGFGAHDQAFTDHFDRYEFRAAQFRKALLGAYPDVPILLRLANSWCCRSTGTGYRRYTGGRVQEFDHRTRRVFGVGSGSSDDRVRFFEPTNMNGRPDIIFDYGVSDANHPRASHVRTEVQMLLNSLCRRDPASGKVRFRA